MVSPYLLKPMRSLREALDAEAAGSMDTARGAPQGVAPGAAANGWAPSRPSATPVTAPPKRPWPNSG